MLKSARLRVNGIVCNLSIRGCSNNDCACNSDDEDEKVIGDDHSDNDDMVTVMSAR